MSRDFTPDALYRPQTQPVWVRAEAMPRFDPHAAGFHLPNAWWLAGAAHLAYYDAAGVAREVARIGWTLLDCFIVGGTEGFLATGGGFAVLAFRGTLQDDWTDIKTDLKVPLVGFAEGIRTHMGFRDALDCVWDRVAAHLTRLAAAGVPVWYTGHSLGAALATLAAARRAPAELYTWGSPRVGDDGLVRALAGVPSYRIVDCCDVVTTLPPELVGYRHVGEFRYITNGLRVRRAPGALTVFQNQCLAQVRYALSLPFRRSHVLFRALADHAIVNYTAGILCQMERDGSVRPASEVGTAAGA